MFSLNHCTNKNQLNIFYISCIKLINSFLFNSGKIMSGNKCVDPTACGCVDANGRYRQVYILAYTRI